MHNPHINSRSWKYPTNFLFNLLYTGISDLSISLCRKQVKLNLYLLEGIHDDIDFCCQLAKEESVILCPGRLEIFTPIVSVK
jgi:hypothetical protein